MTEISRNEKVYTLAQAAKHYAVKKSDLKKAIANGQLEYVSHIPSRRRGMTYMISESQLKSYFSPPVVEVQELPVFVEEESAKDNEQKPREAQWYTADEIVEATNVERMYLMINAREWEEKGMAKLSEGETLYSEDVYLDILIDKDNTLYSLADLVKKYHGQYKMNQVTIRTGATRGLFLNYKINKHRFATEETFVKKFVETTEDTTNSNIDNNVVKPKEEKVKEPFMLSIQIRNRHHLSQYHMAKILGCSQTALSRYERGLDPTPVKIANTLKESFARDCIKFEKGQDKVDTPVVQKRPTLKEIVAEELKEIASINEIKTMSDANDIAVSNIESVETVSVSNVNAGNDKVDVKDELTEIDRIREATKGMSADELRGFMLAMQMGFGK